jgi:signal transduction histidine kinase
VQVEIADRGPGIPADELPKVFEKFFRGRNVRKGGSGLGLAIARRVIRDHGRELMILSVNGSGTKANVALPLSKSS